jgi:hypothetical protein
MMKKRKKTTFLKDLLGGAKGSSGSTELLFVFLTFCLLSLMTFFSYRMILHYQMSQQRQKAYLCIKESFEKHIKTESYIEGINWAITAAYAASLYVSPVAVERLVFALKKAQLIILFQSYYQIFANSNCTKEQGLILISYSSILLNWKVLSIKRNFLGLARFKQKKKAFFYPSQSIKHSDFIIKGEVHYQPKILLKNTKEYSLALLDPINRSALKAKANAALLDFKFIFQNPGVLFSQVLGGIL